MVYDRRIDDDTLTFEASGALKHAALVMRDRETDSWWSIMEAKAIAGDREGKPLRELPVSVKTTWGEWRKRHPGSRVLSVNGTTHLGQNVYQEYLETDQTYPSSGPEDDRLPPKTAIFAFRRDGEPTAVPHDRIEGAVVLRVGTTGDAPLVLLYREAGAPLLESTRAYRLPAALAESDDPDGLARRIEGEIAKGTPGVERIAGFDTFWYTWAAQNPETRIIP